MKPWIQSFIKSLIGHKREERKILAEATAACFQSMAGQIVLAHLLQDIFYSISHVQGLTPEDTAYNEGQRSVVRLFLDLMGEAKHPPEPLKVETNAE